jgi:hypothetical protein
VIAASGSPRSIPIAGPAMANVSPLEFAWLLVNTVTLVFVVNALFDARADRRAVRLLNGKARELAATGIVRRELTRVIKVALLLSVAVPGLFFADGQVRPEPLRVYPIVALMAIALLLLVQSFWDARDRKAMTVLVTAEALVTKTDAFSELKGMLADNTRISQEASDHADKAYHEANDVNNKIARQGAALVEQGEARAAAAAETEAKVDRTEGMVTDLHDGSAPA